MQNNVQVTRNCREKHLKMTQILKVTKKFYFQNKNKNLKTVTVSG